MSQVTEAISEVLDGFETFKKKYDKRVEDLDSNLIEIEKKLNRQGLGGLGGGARKKPAADTFIDVKSRTEVPVLGAADRLADLEPKSHTSELGQATQGDEPSLGRVLRGIVLGNHAHDAKQLNDERKAMGISHDPSGGYLLDDGRLSSRFIDLVRAKMVLNAAGVQTIPMAGPELSLIKLTADPSVSWHAENQTIPESEPTFGRVTLFARTIVCKVLMSLELAQDAANLQQILEASVTAAMAGAIDNAGLNGVAENFGSAPSGLFDLDGRKTVLSIGTPTNYDFILDGMYELLSENMPMDSIGAMIAHPKLWRKLRKLKTGISGDQTPLTMPQEVATMPKLWTTAAPLAGGTTAKAVIADWRQLLFGVRRQITVRVLQNELLADKLQVAMLAYARVSFGATRSASFVTLEGITV